MNRQAIILTNQPNQNFQITLEINGVNTTFQFAIRWNPVAGYWVMTIRGMATGEVLVDSIPLVTGGGNLTLNILRPYDYLNIGKAYLISKVSYPKSEYPKEDNMNEFVLVWEDND